MFIRSIITLALSGAISSCVFAQNTNNAQLDASARYEVMAGTVSSLNDGTFNYQGYLEVDGQPANGSYSFEFEAFEEPTGSDILSELFYTSPLIPVVDGLFFLDVQMGGTPQDAREFWREVGDAEIYLEIRVGLNEGGPYETLTTRTKIGWSARAQYSGIAESLRFPYTDTYTNLMGDPETMISLTSEFGGTIAELRSNSVSNEPVVYIRGANVASPTFSSQSGALLVDSLDDEVGIRGEGARFSVVGFFSEKATLPGVSAALLGSVGFSSSADVVAVWAVNSPAGTSARLGTENYAGDFSGDVRVEGNMRVEGEPVRDYGASEYSPMSPIAYGYINTNGTVASGTANLSSTWDSVSSRYLIGIDGESFFFNQYSAVVTVGGSTEPQIATTSSVGGQLIVYIWDLNSGNIRVQNSFQVVIYKPDPNSLVRNQNPGVVDDDVFYEQTGLRPIVEQIPVQNTPRYTPPVGGGIEE